MSLRLAESSSERATFIYRQFSRAQPYIFTIITGLTGSYSFSRIWSNRQIAPETCADDDRWWRDSCVAVERGHYFAKSTTPRLTSAASVSLFSIRPLVRLTALSSHTSARYNITSFGPASSARFAAVFRRDPLVSARDSFGQTSVCTSNACVPRRHNVVSIRRRDRCPNANKFVLRLLLSAVSHPSVPP